MSYLRDWVAYYSYGADYSKASHKPTDLPPSGLQVLMLYFTDGTRRILHGSDRYFWQDNGSDDGIFGQSDDSDLDILARYPGAHIIEGELLEDETYRAIVTRALKATR